MTAGDTKARVKDARDMVAVFASVGARHFDLTITNIGGEKVFYKRAQPFGEFNRDLPGILDAATVRRHNVIVRPNGPGVHFIQLDDLSPAQIVRVAPAVFLTLRTSPGNFQAWAALAGAEDKDFARRLRKGTEADATASGATRIAGSFNFKEKYAPEFPRVVVEAARACQKTTRAELDQLGLVAPRETVPGRPARLAGSTGPRAWPDYQRCVRGAPSGSDPVSRADFVWCMIAIDWGWSTEAVAARLMEESRKAQENGERYVLRTVESAAAAVARGPARKPLRGLSPG